MMWLIARRDMLERWRDGRLLWAGGMILVLLLTALAIGYEHRQQARAEQRAAQTADYVDWLKQGRRHPHDAAHQGMHAFKPEASLALIDPGINPYIGSTIWLQAHRQSEVMFRPAQDATGLQRFGDLSAGWILQVLGPLLVIVLGFNAFAGEREQGILRQAISLGIPTARMLWGKAIALGLSVLTLLVPAGILGAAAVLIGADTGAGVDALSRIGLLAFGYAMYLAVFVFLTLGVSAAASTSRVAITVLLALWIGNAVIAPRVMAELSRRMYPTPTRLEFNQALGVDLKATSDQLWMANFGTTERWGRDVPLSKWGLALQLDDHASYAVYDRHFGHLWDTWERQQRLQEWSGALLPMLAMRSLSMDAAGTDFAHHRDFTSAAERHRRLIQDIVSDDLVRHADVIGGQHFAYQSGPELWKKIPAFDYHPPAASWAIQHSWRSVLALCVALALAFTFAWRAAARQRAF
jgi:ABC-2 type transport system permease protein